jgi:uncharacterized membrane protein YphA (DoxX/SURF4 family)
MTQVSKASLLCLRWTLGVVLFIEAAVLAFSRSEIHFASRPGVHRWALLALAWSEMIACILLLVPRTVKIGARLLLIVFALAAVVHILHSNFQVGGLLVYAAATWVTLSQSQLSPKENQHD